jgi:hypothetical protein
MEGKEVFTLVVENFGTLSAGTVALIMALRNRVHTIKITKNGFELKGIAKDEALSGKS